MVGTPLDTEPNCLSTSRRHTGQATRKKAHSHLEGLGEEGIVYLEFEKLSSTNLWQYLGLHNSNCAVHAEKFSSINFGTRENRFAPHIWSIEGSGIGPPSGWFWLRYRRIPNHQRTDYSATQLTSDES
jgi:hypothetical protein